MDRQWLRITFGMLVFVCAPVLAETSLPRNEIIPVIPAAKVNAKTFGPDNSILFFAVINLVQLATVDMIAVS
ncbi:hypothetical protein [Polymorphobacter sp.]|uniref:hypothetical protein n=1 Tax=Polymorphobacter sp. TaxID=1909290 RepID=UPI003F703474